MKILCELRICTNIENTDLFKSNQLYKNEERIDQSVNGIRRFFEFKNILEQHQVDVYVTDNTIKYGETLNKKILDVLPDKAKIITCMNNNFGCKNKGAGDIEQWIYCKDIIEKYNWFIHFEPRQYIENFDFFNTFLKAPCNLFTYGENKQHFNTGLFAIKSSILLDFINIYTPRQLGSKSIEYVLYDYIKNNKINFNTLDKMNLIRYDATTKKTIHC